MAEPVGITETGRGLIEEYLSRVGGTHPDRQAVPPRPAGALVPLTYAQEQIWLHTQIAAGVPLYNEPVTVLRRGPLDPALLERCLNEIVRRHEAWRTTFATQNGQPVQVILPELKIALPVLDLRLLPQSRREPEAVRLAADDARRPFDLEQGPLLRASLFQMDEEDYRLSLTIHHLIFDGVSIHRVFLQELVEIYEAFSRGEPSPLPEPAVQYGDYAVWQRQPAQEAAMRQHLSFWRKHLAGDLPVLQLPVDHPRPAVCSHRAAVQPLSIPKDLVSGLKEITQRERATFFMTLLATLNVLLHRYTGQEDIVVGTPSAGRNRPEVQKLLGMFTNVLVLRSRFSGDTSFRELLARVREVTLGALCHCEAPFELLVKELQPSRDPGRSPVFQVLFSLVPSMARAADGWRITQFGVDAGVTKAELVVELDERPQGIEGRLIYSTDIFEQRTAARMAEHWQALMRGIAADPDRPIGELPLVAGAERRQVLVDWNATEREYPRDRCVHELFSLQAARTPDAVALELGNDTLSYAELENRSNRLACHLRSLGAGRETPVAISMDRSMEMIVGLLAILKAGGAYVPLDPSYPPERLAYMLRDSGARVLLTEQRLAGRLSAEGLETVLVDAGWPDIAAQSDEALDNAADPDSLAYIVYTSGTTGQPKGVLVTHRGVVRLVQGADYARFGPGEVFLQLAPVSFDASTFEIWGALLNGARLAIMPPGKVSLADLGQAIRRHGVTTLWLTAGLFHLMVDERLEDLGSLRQLLAGGDVLSVPHTSRVLQRFPQLKLINGYGPTENTTFTCCHQITLASLNGSVPIGRPIANTKVYLLDNNRQPVPVGVPGELYIGGDGLARGYLNSPELNAARFVPDPFGGGRLYRTGDLARYRQNGVIEFLGRVDQQVKIRGFRVELGEVEAAIARQESVKEAVVIAREETGSKTLAAYVVPGEGKRVDARLASEIRERLETSLPDYMRPSSITLLERLPLTENGKVDRSALPPPGEAHRPMEDFSPARDELEQRLVAIWEKILDVRPIGTKANFFELGGHSLMAARLIARIEQEFGQRLSMAELFQAPTVAQLAARLRNPAGKPRSSAVVPMRAGGSRPPFFCVGAGPYLLPMVERLGADQPFFGLTLDPEEARRLPRPYRFEDVAQSLIRSMRQQQPKGPYYLGGWCQSGMMALEMAQQLTAAGERVRLLVLFDAYNTSYYEAAVRNAPVMVLRDKFSYQVRNLRRLGWRGLPQYAAARISDFGLRLQRFLWRLSYRCGAALPELKQIQYVSAGKYQPRPYSGRVVLFQPVVRPESHFWDCRKGWEGLIAGLEAYEIPGDHATMFTEPNVNVLAAVMDKGLRGAGGPPGKAA